ncbi:mannose-P-dolichol utilization defect 1 protein-like [Sparus aurata]|uniref:Mannose-P-dolichol utilization defect 1a n=1 Tax=Sparus aurata TaxID=8175 RepID=A0A671YGD5_SPAAU|nr:mannose-P-dolichol utilization defect 1 protein-like [Sparus aurata]
MQLPGHTLVMSERPSEIRVHCPGPVSSPCKHLGDLCALPQSAAPVTAQRPGCSSWTTMATSPVRHFLVSFVMPKKCYEEIFVHLHMHVPCLKFILNKIFGFWILLETFLAQPPQLVKILWRRSAAGISLTSALLQLYAFSWPVVYAMAHNFPLFAYAEKLLALAQTAAIVFLILHYRGDTLRGALFLSAYGGVIFLLGSYAVAAVTSAMQASSVAALIGSKALQARTNHHNGHTGQLSTLSVLLSCAGSLGVAVMSLQETGGSFTTLSHMLSACLSCVLVVQVLCYSSAETPRKRNASKCWRTVTNTDVVRRFFLRFKKSFEPKL